MAKLLDNEEEDDFYKTTYGGFNDLEEDNDYVEEKEVEDMVDSDFDIDEDDEPGSDQEVEEKRKRRFGTKAYQDPKRKAKKLAPKPKKEEPKKPIESESETTDLDDEDDDENSGGDDNNDDDEDEEENETDFEDTVESDPTGRKSIRQSTAVKSAETMQRIKIRSELQKKKPKKCDYKMPTQEEMLAEAVITERENLESLKQFEQIELERKKQRPTKKTLTGPLIRYHSFAVPINKKAEEPDLPILDMTDVNLSNSDIDVIPEIPESKLLDLGDVKPQDVTIKMDVDEPKEESDDFKKEDVVEYIGLDEEIKIEGSICKTDKPIKRPECGQYFERTLITFVDDIKDKAFDAAFPRPKPKKKREYLCAITKLPARYIDPITKLPYRSVDAFRIIREAYYQQLEMRGDRNTPEIAEWLKWRQADKHSRYVNIHIK